MLHKGNTGYLKCITYWAHSSLVTDNSSPFMGKWWENAKFPGTKTLTPSGHWHQPQTGFFQVCPWTRTQNWILFIFHQGLRESHELGWLSIQNHHLNAQLLWMSKSVWLYCPQLMCGPCSLKILSWEIRLPWQDHPKEPGKNYMVISLHHLKPHNSPSMALCVLLFRNTGS